MKLVCTKTRIKYNGQRYYPNVPFDLDVKEIPEELKNLVEVYEGEKVEEKKQFVSPRRSRDGLLKKDEPKKKTKKTNAKDKANVSSVKENSNLLDEVADLI